MMERSSSENDFRERGGEPWDSKSISMLNVKEAFQRLDKAGSGRQGVTCGILRTRGADATAFRVVNEKVLKGYSIWLGDGH